MSLLGPCEVEGCGVREDYFTIHQHQYILDDRQGEHIVCADHHEEITEHPERFHVMFRERTIRRTTPEEAT